MRKRPLRFLYDKSWLGEPLHHTPTTSPAVVPTYPLALCLCRAYEESSFADAVRWHLYDMCTQVFKYLWTTLDTSDQQDSSFQLVLCSWVRPVNEPDYELSLGHGSLEKGSRDPAWSIILNRLNPTWDDVGDVGLFQRVQ